jgi:hypothetical protein
MPVGHGRRKLAAEGGGGKGVGIVEWSARLACRLGLWPSHSLLDYWVSATTPPPFLSPTTLPPHQLQPPLPPETAHQAVGGQRVVVEAAPGSAQGLAQVGKGALMLVAAVDSDALPLSTPPSRGIQTYEQPSPPPSPFAHQVSPCCRQPQGAAPCPPLPPAQQAPSPCPVSS